MILPDCMPRKIPRPIGIGNGLRIGTPVALNTYRRPTVSPVEKEVTLMDKVAKGMSQAGRHPNECCHKEEGLLRRMAHSLKGAATRVGHILTGRQEARARSAR
jgi:hypothetical protein